MTQPVTFLCLAGSARAASFNQRLAAAAAREAGAQGAVVTLLSPRDYAMPLYDGDLEAREGAPHAAVALANHFKTAQAVFIASPEYNASISPFLKNALDWVSRVKADGEPPLFAYKNRVFAIGSASPGALGGMRGLIALRHCMELGLGALVLPDQIAVPNAGQAFDEAGALTDDRSAAALKRVVGAAIDAAARFRR
ncbi:MAG: NAD(P)H-dependent oxidoreductase [Hyphomicrobiales bacterium]|nr:NAD(P)H-dependent oxidoreductase [Hyphomicrobiales bacterium]